MLERVVLGQVETHRRRIAAAIRALVAAGALDYVYDHGCSFIIPSFRGPVRISRRVILKPPECTDRSAEGRIVINLRPGAAFGSGAHPSTRTALRCLDDALRRRMLAKGATTAGMLDVGTGSGVLLIAALRMGLEQAVGIDTDACAVAEARANLQCNGLSACATISDRDLATIHGRFGLIAANLRYPSLIRYARTLADRLVWGGVMVVAGIQTGEFAAVRTAYDACGLTVLFKRTDSGWVGAACRKNAAAASRSGGV